MNQIRKKMSKKKMVFCIVHTTGWSSGNGSSSANTRLLSNVTVIEIV